MVKFQLRHGNDLLAMDSLRESDVSPNAYVIDKFVFYNKDWIIFKMTGQFIFVCVFSSFPVTSSYSPQARCMNHHV